MASGCHSGKHKSRACFPNLGSFERWAITLRTDAALGQRGQVEPGSQSVSEGWRASGPGRGGSHISGTSATSVSLSVPLSGDKTSSGLSGPGEWPAQEVAQAGHLTLECSCQLSASFFWARGPQVRPTQTDRWGLCYLIMNFSVWGEASLVLFVWSHSGD